MKLWKISAVACMLLASTSFGAVTLGAPDQINQAADGTWTVNLTINVTGGEAACGFGLFGIPSLASGVTVTRTSINSLITDLTTSSITDRAVTSTSPDLGGLVTDVGGGPWITTTSPLLTLVYKAPAGSAPITINWTGTWVDATTIDTGGPLTGTTVLAPPVPEPVSGLMLAVGGLFFARRRRA